MPSIGLISDVHSEPAPVAEALEIFAREGVEQVFCAGDIAGYHAGVRETVDLLQASRCVSVLGNHDYGYLQAHAGETADPVLQYFSSLPAFIDIRVAGKRLYMVHAQPPAACHGGIKLRDRTGQVRSDRVAQWEQQLNGFAPDVLIVGHTHQVYAVTVGHTLVVNPGSSVFNCSCAILDVQDLSVRHYPLGGQAIRYTWNWSDHFGKGGRIPA